MEKKNLFIKDYEDKKGKDSGKRYTRFETNLGWFSAFEKDVIEPIKLLEGKWALCGIVITEKNKNIREFHGPGVAEDEPTTNPSHEAREGTANQPEIEKIAREVRGGKDEVSIVAQCLTKAAAQMISGAGFKDPESLSNLMKEAVKAVHKSYKDLYQQLKSDGI